MSELNFLSPRFLRDYADGRSFERGEDYFKSECVFSLEEYNGKIVARVSGTHDYKVKLWVEDENELGYDCNCPYADEGNFCKHCVAVGLAWIAKRKNKIKQKSHTEKRRTNIDDVKAYLQTREKSELVEMLMQEVLENDNLRRDLMLIVARNNPQGVDFQAFRKELKRAIEIDDFIDYYETYNYTRNIESVIFKLAELLETHSEAVVDLCEYGLKLASKSMENIDDSDGEMGSVLDELQTLHLKACEKAKPDAEKLAQRLFESELEDSYDVFYDASTQYADVLGKKGLALYQKLTEAEWEKLPALKAGDRHSFEGNRNRITHMMESLANSKGDIEKLVEIKSRDLSSQYRFYEIASIYESRKQYDKALEWAEQGISDFPKTERLDSRLGEFLANEYHRRKRHDEAMQIIWKQFENDSDFSNYGILKKHADKVKPVSTWRIWREKALDLIRQKIAERKNKQSSSLFYYPADNSLIVTIFLHEKLFEEAWQEASNGGCSEDLWLKLAKIREKEHPADALKIYRDRIEPKIKETNNQAYDQAVKWIKEVKRLMLQLGKESEFERYLVTLRINYKIKRNFIKLLDTTKW